MTPAALSALAERLRDDLRVKGEAKRVAAESETGVVYGSEPGEPGERGYYSMGCVKEDDVQEFYRVVMQRTMKAAVVETR